MLPQSQNKNIQHQNIISTPSPSPRVEPFLQYLRVQTQESSPPPPPRQQPSTPPILDPNSNPCIKIFKNIKTPRFIKTRKLQAAAQQLQQQLNQSPRNIGKNFHTQASHRLVSNHLFKLPHDYHIYHRQG